MPASNLSETVRTIVDETPVLDIHTHIYNPAFGGLLLWGREEVGFGDGLFFRFGDFDKDDKDTLSCMGVGLLGLLTPPYDRRPCAAPA